MEITKTVTLKAYEFTTPKFAGEMQYESTYDCEILEKLFKAIMQLDKSKRKYKNKTVSLNLGAFNQSDNANIVEGHFITARHGIRRSQIDIDTQEEVGTIETYHGVEAEVYFMIDRTTGLFIIQDDFNKVFSRSLLLSFLHQHKHMIYPYVNKFNEINTQHPFVIHKRSCYRLQTLPPIDFMEKLGELTKVRSAILTLDSESPKENIDVSKILDAELEDNDISEYDLEIKIKNKTGKSMIRTFKKYFEFIITQQKYDSYAIEGELSNGKTKKITPDTITRDFYAQVRFNEVNGLPKIDDIYNRMTEVILRENPLNEKGGTPNIIPVGENTDVEVAIQKEISQTNENQEDQEGEEQVG